MLCPGGNLTIFLRLFTHSALLLFFGLFLPGLISLLLLLALGFFALLFLFLLLPLLAFSLGVPFPLLLKTPVFFGLFPGTLLLLGFALSLALLPLFFTFYSLFLVFLFLGGLGSSLFGRFLGISAGFLLFFGLPL